ncbi:hypothetical protein TEQG_04538 [Trichophyton equinum CBS 127.97]|uniref:Uncharacterized protein n=1 Tax=Trichophyton equinum (strain ATCC MYA-4606 / CBS 127.97) TaxID=559882 RepID=F2PUG1_TRIEC|nr:hypothetical protein TEQG_04538 [Trichophyton equinum CBS 127.97]
MVFSFPPFPLLSTTSPNPDLWRRIKHPRKYEYQSPKFVQETPAQSLNFSLAVLIEHQTEEIHRRESHRVDQYAAHSPLLQRILRVLNVDPGHTFNVAAFNVAADPTPGRQMYWAADAFMAERKVAGKQPFCHQLRAHTSTYC